MDEKLWKYSFFTSIKMPTKIKIHIAFFAGDITNFSSAIFPGWAAIYLNVHNCVTTAILEIMKTRAVEETATDFSTNLR